MAHHADTHLSQVSLRPVASSNKRTHCFVSTGWALGQVVASPHKYRHSRNEWQVG